MGDCYYALDMNLETATSHIEKAFAKMADKFGDTIFDEWVIVDFSAKNDPVIHYAGPRREKLVATFTEDTRILRGLIRDKSLSAGDFEFTKEADGAGYDAILSLGSGLFLLCNNTRTDMGAVTKDPAWKLAQVDFVTLSEKFQMDELSL